MFQLNVSGEVKSHQAVKDPMGNTIGGDILLSEKMWVNGAKQERIWNVHVGKSTYERFVKAAVQIKYFGFLCWRLEVESIYKSSAHIIETWLHVSASDYFTL